MSQSDCESGGCGREKLRDSLPSWMFVKENQDRKKRKWLFKLLVELL